MDLHTAGAQPEWLAVPAAERNIWQRLATWSHGFLAPANVITIGGLVVVFVGIYSLWRHHYLAGLLLIAAGRAADVLDGWTAHATGTKSRFGEKLDATIDKIGTLSTLLALPLLGVVGWWVVVILALPQVVATVVALVALRRGIIVHPSRVGKLGMTAAWLSMLVFLTLPLWPHNRALTVAGYTLLTAGVLLAAMAINGYRQAMIRHT